MLPFAVREKRSGEIVGSTRFLRDRSRTCRRIAIGYTWYAGAGRKATSTPPASACCWRTRSKRWGAWRWQFHTDERNEDSQRAIERLGAQREGVLRAHKRRPDGSLRNTVCYRSSAREWPDVDAGWHCGWHGWLQRVPG